uniref:Secreted protein n=1 Tax=Schistosoma curassoni TaxID=6186 RepID=A0A183KH81_9TREM
MNFLTTLSHVNSDRLKLFVNVLPVIEDLEIGSAEPARLRVDGVAVLVPSGSLPLLVLVVSAVVASGR